jgi:hypothetical protein
MNRRNFLTTSAVAAVTVLTGCTDTPQTLEQQSAQFIDFISYSSNARTLEKKIGLNSYERVGSNFPNTAEAINTPVNLDKLTKKLRLL